MKKVFIVWITVIFVLVPAISFGAFKSPLIDTPAQEWKVADWINSPSLKLQDLKGKVVLVRFWTAPHCPFCSTSAPALNEFHESYKERGLAVIGLYHHKASTSFDVKSIKEYSSDFGFQFPIAIDYEWKTLKDWWLNHSKRGWTSVSFLIDKEGIIRYVHPGGRYVKGDEDYKELKSMIETLLSR